MSKWCLYNEKIIIRCEFCKQKIRLPILSQTLNVTCPNKLCQRTFEFNYKKYKINAKLNLSLTFILSFLLLGSAILILGNWDKYFDKRQALSMKEQIIQKENNKEIIAQYKTKIDSIKVRFEKELSDIDKSNLKILANIHYNKIWESRLNYDAAYALSTREQVLLKMKKLSDSSNNQVTDIITDIAKTASPNNSKINIRYDSHGLILDIDFDMSELTTGEMGTTTKHNTITSLKKEAILLISQVTNDIFKFCSDLGIESIQIGCRHFVRQYLNQKYQNDKNIIIYKVKLDKKDLENLENNPFINLFATTEKLQVIIDDFPNLEIDFYSR